MTELSGTAESVTFRNEDSGFTVFELNTGKELVTVVGVLSSVMPGEQLRISGSWTVHATFGQQFRAEAVEHIRPKSSGAIFRFLASGAIKGVGAVTAKNLVDTFGEHTLEIIENEPQRLCELRGITPLRAQRISGEFKKMFGVREAMLFLGEYGITPAETMRVWKVWGVSTVERIKADPYLLCTEGLRIGFDRADALAQAMGFSADSQMRVRAGTVHGGAGQNCHRLRDFAGGGEDLPDQGTRRAAGASARGGLYFGGHGGSAAAFGHGARQKRSGTVGGYAARADRRPV